MAGDAALAAGPVACGEIVQHLREVVLRELFRELLLRIRIRKQVLDACESGLRGGVESV